MKSNVRFKFNFFVHTLQIDVSGPERDRPISGLQKQRFEEYTRDAVAKGVKGVLDEYFTYLKPYVPPNVTRTAFDANTKRNRYGGEFIL